MIYFSAQEEVVEKNSEFENSDNLKKRSKSQCPLLWSKKPLATNMIYLGDLKEVVEKSSEFENSDNLKEGSISQ